MSWYLQVGARSNVGDMEKEPFYQFIQKTYPIHPIMMAVALYAIGGFPYIVWGMVSDLFLVILENNWFCYYLTFAKELYQDQRTSRLTKSSVYMFVRRISRVVYCFCGAFLQAETISNLWPKRISSIFMQAVRTVWVYHITWFVNSASHVWGSQKWNTGDLSRNNWWAFYCHSALTWLQVLYYIGGFYNIFTSLCLSLKISLGRLQLHFWSPHSLVLQLCIKFYENTSACRGLWPRLWQLKWMSLILAVSFCLSSWRKLDLLMLT